MMILRDWFMTVVVGILIITMVCLLPLLIFLVAAVGGMYFLYCCVRQARVEREKREQDLIDDFLIK